MAFKLTEAAQRRVDEMRAWHEKRTAEFASLSNEDLITTTQVFMRNSVPKEWAPGEPVYDATLWHVILPELMRRAAGKAEPVAWQWRYVGETAWKTAVGGEKYKRHDTEVRPLFAAPTALPVNQTTDELVNSVYVAVRNGRHSGEMREGIRSAIAAAASLAEAQEREACAKVAEQKGATAHLLCERLGNADPETGARECSLSVHGRDCLCNHAHEKGEEIAKAIRARQ